MQLPFAPTAGKFELRGDYSTADADFVVEQSWSSYSSEQHGLWNRLVNRQMALIRRYGASQVLQGLNELKIGETIPRFEDASRVLRRASGWEIIGVPGLIPEKVFFAHLAHRRFPVTLWLRDPEEIDYLAEPDLFHDFFGHVPLLCHPVFADFMQAYGAAGEKATAAGGIHVLARLYWYCVEFGLILEGGELRAYGSGILSSAGETVYSVESAKPHRIRFDLERVTRTDYLIDDFQQTYFVIDSFEQLFRESYDRDFAPLYRDYRDAPAIAPNALLPTDRLVAPRKAPSSDSIGD
jgi:phenylalanine-4-hydroxylase